MGNNRIHIVFLPNISNSFCIHIFLLDNLVCSYYTTTQFVDKS